MAKDIFQNYISSVSSKFAHEETSEMGYRTDFELLLKGVFEAIKISRFDHDAKAKHGNKPDFVVVKNDVPLLYIETKDIGVSLNKVEKSEQMARYFGYTNLILTDYLEFRFYRDGIPYGEPVKIAEYDKRNRTITPLSQNYDLLEKTLLDFIQSHKEPIRSGKHLAKIMGGKGQRIRDNIRDILASEQGKKTELMNVYETLRRLLVHDLTPESFADMYAQTLVYGLFVARFYDNSLSSFSRQEARDLIPASNPFLGHFFDHIAGRNFEKRLSYIVDELCTVFSHANVAELMEQHFKSVSKKGAHRGQDQVIHFYEDFLKEYDEDLRKRMGAYYTPLPVVQFIVRSVDRLLEKEFGLTGGLANTSKTKDGLHRVQVLDPAVGTGTFISDVIGKIYTRIKDGGQKGRWPAYVHHELLPRIYGFELMMAPYTIAHLKLSMALKETGFLYFNETRSGKARLGIYLTNSLEEVNKQPELLAFDFGASIAEEAKQASKIKNEKPIMVVLGNPPYAGISSNETKYANSLVERYKVEPGGKQKLQERKHWLNNDYVKFMAMAESMIDKTGDGILAMITDNGYLDNPTFRGMRWHLAKTFDKIYVYDLHGSTKKFETTPDGEKDENVFDIMQGVGIILGVKTGKKKQDELGDVYHADLYGTRKYKFDVLASKSPKWQKLTLDDKMVYFVPRNTEGLDKYNEGFKVDKLFYESVTGVITARDSVVVDTSKSELEQRMRRFADPKFSDTETRNWLYPNRKPGKYKPGDTRGWKLTSAREEVRRQNIEENIRDIAYRPFDKRHIYYVPEMVDWGRFEFMRNMDKANIGLNLCRQVISTSFNHIFITNRIVDDSYVSNKSRERGYLFPLYLYHGDGSKTSNLKPEIVDEIEKVVGKTDPEDIFDYIYAVLHSPSYRGKYNEFLKLDFPRVPYPSDKKIFRQLVKLGRELRLLHLLESPKLGNFVTSFPESGSYEVEKIEYKDGKVFINSEQYFGNTPETAWEFTIGGYQPAQKWLKDRKGEKLTNGDIEHYQKIIVALVETDRLMKKIDEVMEGGQDV